MSHLFVSYARADRERVRRHVEQLKSAGFVVRWDEDQRGQDYDRQLKEWIGAAAAVVVFWSLTSVARNAVRGEVNYADLIDGNKIINVKIDPIEVKSLPLCANPRDIIDLSCPDRGELSDGLLKLIATCAELTGCSIPAAAPAPTGRTGAAQGANPPSGSISIHNNSGVVGHTIKIIGPVTTGG